MSITEKNVQETSKTKQDHSEEGADKSAENSGVACGKEEAGAAGGKEDLEKSDDPKLKESQVIKEMRENIDEASKVAGEQFWSFKSKPGDAKAEPNLTTDAANEEPQTEFANCDPNTQSSFDREVHERMEVFNQRIDRMLFDSFLGAEYKGKRVVDMFGFSSHEEQALRDWTILKQEFLESLSKDVEFIARNVGEVGPNVYDSNNNNSTALMIACGFGNLKAVVVLLNSGARVNDCNLHGRTALMEAVEGGYLDVVRLLVASGANLHSTDRNGDTALSLAERQGNLEVVEFLNSAIHEEKSASKDSESTLSADEQVQMESQSPPKGYIEVVKFLRSTMHKEKSPSKDSESTLSAEEPVQKESQFSGPEQDTAANLPGVAENSGSHSNLTEEQSKELPSPELEPSPEAPSASEMSPPSPLARQVPSTPSPEGSSSDCSEQVVPDIFG